MKLMISALTLSLALAAPVLAQSYAFTNGRVVTNTAAGIIDNGTVVVRDGSIVDVGANAVIPEGAEVIDAQGGWITPGVFAPVTQLGLIEVALEASTNDSGADESEYSVALNVADSFNPNGTHIDATRIEGITRAALFPSTGANIFAGQGALISTSGEFDSLFEESHFIVADLTQSGASTAGGSRAAAWAFLEAAVMDARWYPGRYAATHHGDALGRYDAGAFVPAVRGEVLLIISVDRAADIRRALRFQRESAPIRIILHGAAEAWMVADEIAAAGVPVLFDPIRNLPGSFDRIGSTLEAAAHLHEAGVSVAYTTQSADGYFNVRLLTQHAGNAVAHGVPWDAAFRAITLTPAEIYGVDARYGTLSPGYAADIVVWDGDPLEVMSGATFVMIDGDPADMTSRQTQLRDRYINITQEEAYGYRD